MNRRRLAPLVGIVGCLLVAGLLAVPYVLVRTSPGTTLATYYGTGALNPLVAGVFALVAVIVLAAGREERTDPVTAAGIGLSLGVFLFAVVALWALTVPEEVVLGMDAPQIMQYHPWVTTAAAASVPAAAAWWARTLGLV